MSALIIGINTYKSKRLLDLKGAVSDVIAIEQYLKNILQIPESRIRRLTEEAATRKNIIDTFETLKNDRSINRGDAILIYYAGHGQTIEAPEGWDTEKGNNIQSIVPHDFDGDNIHVIPDYTLGWLIYKISEEHGDNIVSL